MNDHFPGVPPSITVPHSAVLQTDGEPVNYLGVRTLSVRWKIEGAVCLTSAMLQQLSDDGWTIHTVCLRRGLVAAYRYGDE